MPKIDLMRVDQCVSDLKLDVSSSSSPSNPIEAPGFFDGGITADVDVNLEEEEELDCLKKSVGRSTKRGRPPRTLGKATTNPISRKKREDEDDALKAALNYGEMDEYTAAEMILAGIPLDEPHLKNHLSILLKTEKSDLKAGKLPVTESCYLMGTVDPTGELKEDEICVILESGQISGEVLVYRNPGIHFGDIHILKATYVKALEEYVGNSKYDVFFPRKGPRSLGDEIAGGDFDGDTYFISRNPELLKYFKPSRKRVGIEGKSSATIAIVGYTNAGKSTLTSALTKSSLYCNERLDPTFKSAQLPSGKKVILSDTIGFISDLPIQLVEAFQSTLEEVVEADLLLHVVDSTAQNIEEHRSTVFHVLNQIGVSEEKLQNMIEVWNKVGLK